MTMNTGNMWKCPQCGRENTGRFCVICGTKRPEEAEAEPIEIPTIDAMIAETVDTAVNDAEAERTTAEAREEVIPENTADVMIPSASVSEEKTEPKEVNFSSRPVQEEPKREERSAAMTRETYQKPKALYPKKKSRKEEQSGSHGTACRYDRTGCGIRRRLSCREELHARTHRDLSDRSGSYNN